VSWHELIASQGAPFWKLLMHSGGAFWLACIAAALLTKTPFNARPPADRLVDMWYWLALPIVRIGCRAVLAVLLVLGAGVLGWELAPTLFVGFGPVMEQPRWLVLLELLVLMDLSSYLSHRLAHTVPWLWRVHAVHHSAKIIRWSSTGRVHPLNDLLNYMSATVPCLVLGFPLADLMWIAPALSIYGIAAHTDWSLKFGPLRHLLVSPTFHRWHHTHSHEGGNKNFANLFSFWDHLFGTYYFPQDRMPETFGVDDDSVPQGYLAQLAYPFVGAGEPAPQTQRAAREGGARVAEALGLLVPSAAEHARETSPSVATPSAAHATLSSNPPAITPQQLRFEPQSHWRNSMDMKRERA
jgi:sterol desaturase/sphingolipid hydroxylase (fatty acid hydroxylase superfamily)